MSKKKVEIDPKAEIRAKIDTGMVFKKIVEFIKVLYPARNKKVSNIVYFSFDKYYITYKGVAQPPKKHESEMKLKVVCRIKGYKLSEYIFKSEKPQHIIGLNLTDFMSKVNICGSTDFFMMIKNANKNGLITTTLPTGQNYTNACDFSQYTSFTEPSYTTSNKDPLCVIEMIELCTKCAIFKKINSKSISINVYSNGLTLADTTVRESDKYLINGELQYVGNVSQTDTQEETPIKCYTSKHALIKLHGISKLYNRNSRVATARIYVERDSRGVLKPIKIVFPLMCIGTGIAYLPVRENHN